ncbi:hypothetical protein [Paludibaculum fermentans]|uniref:Uncharacterized protein n=1 Tax=Paludibaculum fermentans TaxID=1473598 RepID=A0A7S7NQ42_PALFE|nr:hypothetical protein [Paludibaculum fermentans]QOY87717.1 hypothetical protein IRI77_34060 [Paludibaculum fermentans]
MRAVALSRFSVPIFLMAVSLLGQPASVDLTISPDSAPRNAGRASTRIVARVKSESPPRSVVLRLSDEAGKTLSTLGAMHDDGLNGDAAAHDGSHTLQMTLPIDKIGVYYFQAHVELPPPLSPLDSKAAPFWVSVTTEINSDNDLDGSNDGNINSVIVAITQTGIRRLRIYRSNSASGPWDEIFPFGNKPSNFDDESRGIPRLFDPDKAATTRDRYYRVTAYDASGVLKKTFRPVYIPAYAEQDRLLRLVVNPVESQAVTAKPPAAAEKRAIERKR